MEKDDNPKHNISLWITMLCFVIVAEGFVIAWMGLTGAARDAMQNRGLELMIELLEKKDLWSQ